MYPMKQPTLERCHDLSELRMKWFQVQSDTLMELVYSMNVMASRIPDKTKRLRHIDAIVDGSWGDKPEVYRFSSPNYRGKLTYHNMPYAGSTPFPDSDLGGLIYDLRVHEAWWDTSRNGFEQDWFGIVFHSKDPKSNCIVLIDIYELRYLYWLFVVEKMNQDYDDKRIGTIYEFATCIERIDAATPRVINYADILLDEVAKAVFKDQPVSWMNKDYEELTKLASILLRLTLGLHRDMEEVALRGPFALIQSGEQILLPIELPSKQQAAAILLANIFIRGYHPALISRK